MSFTHARDEVVDRWLIIVFAPKLEDALVPLRDGLKAHAGCGLDRVVNVELISEVVEALQHHEFHCLLELGAFFLVFAGTYQIWKQVARLVEPISTS